MPAPSPFSTCLLWAGLLLLKGSPAAAEALHSERGGLHSTPLAHRPSRTAAMLDPLRSLAITDHAIVSTITARSVFEQLVSQAGPSGFTAEQLFRQLWDTQNPAPGAADLPGGPHCSDNGNTLNGAPYVCRSIEGIDATDRTPASIDSYVLVGLFNRFDLAPADGADCGEYRMSFARFVPAPQARSRNRFIFEGVLPNPTPELGLEGCRPVARAWADLSTVDDPLQRGRLVKALFFEGVGSDRNPVIHPHHYGDNPTGAGQLRTNQFMQLGVNEPSPWLLREFKLEHRCDATRCTLRFIPVTTKSTPRGNFFNALNTTPLAVGFREHFITQVASLAVEDFHRFNYVVPDIYNAAQSSPQLMRDGVDDFIAQFNKAPTPNPFFDALQAELQRIGSPLSPHHIVARAESLSCGGCHEHTKGRDLGGGVGTFPIGSPRFVQSNDLLFPPPQPGDPRLYGASTTHTSTLLPFRQQILGAFLDTPPLDAGFVRPGTEVASVQAGQVFQGTVTVTNTGTTKWSAANDTRGISLDGTAHLELDAGDALLLGQSKTFSFTHTAPTVPGLATYRWRMQRAGTAFGPELSFTLHVLPASGAAPRKR
ncbi:hypothetical protein MYSTI_05844 [Myxococcus stipitatus DSM 14675]|uniref:Nbr1 FW domain-containing protein n=1 Tax=Myxococcus stipitatus (strain DSM 14675 / JCM 12634 / Mx s8) TaxID=1278073 RepID=L7UGW7_MYXSD|nr:NBR1-Ig-like domain-containing protein [Myxococcus stipitatus]AGC47120.1 hypothetical protein MYSTI_05844 [Myxococcus stipitatus DSM 14675]